MPLAQSPLFLPRLTGLGLALGITTASLWALGSEANRQHEELTQAQFQRSTVVAQSCSLQPSRGLRS
ncbi:hypothetical protein LRH25_15935 [Ideonella azotifigens]|uniref:Uncharacterized protein n=1 Tax=Ideonella azotifigens TaxID=513160 RepID=A0ABP3USL5_9BURK|nr:hypothetical protein [Ideonella azotifigens]MCD2341832.1 hypothetical protein [Ideonella azotifigens]